MAKKKKINYFCEMCESIKEGRSITRKVDSPFHKSTHGKVCKICLDCAPFTKEWNEYQDGISNNPYKYW